jgi:hypothetical protein
MAAALEAQGLGHGVDILDDQHDHAKQHSHGLSGWLSALFGGHDDHHLYAEGLRRGHVLVIAKVDELDETRAAIIMEAAAMNLGALAATWGIGDRENASDEKRPKHHTYQNPLDTSLGVTSGSSYSATFGGVRTYTL